MLPVIGLLITFIIILTVVLWRILTETHLIDGARTGGRAFGDKYQERALAKYKHLKPPKKRIPYSEFCHLRGKYKVQPQQKLVGDYMRPGGPDSFLVVHKIGAGKTCLSIQIGLHWRGKSAIRGGSSGGAECLVAGEAPCTRCDDEVEPTSEVTTGGAGGSSRPLYVMPASLIPGFRAELRSPCGGDYLTAGERESLGRVSADSDEAAEIIHTADLRIDRDFNIMSYNKFADLATSSIGKVAAPILIVDEMQNINTPGGKYYAAVRKWTEHYAGPIVLMSATPLFDNSEEIRGIATLMRLNPPPVMTPDDIRKMFAGRISYFEGAPSYTFPSVTVQVKKCKMSQHQARWYRAQVEAEMKKTGEVKIRDVAESFYIKSRQKSNVVYPKGVSGQAGLDLLTPALIRENLQTYSTKYAALVKKLLRGGLSFVYSSFTGAGGIAFLRKCLIANGFKDYFEDGPGRRRFVVWSGDQTMREKRIIRDVFNSAENDDASQIQIVIGSSAIKEGVSLMRVRTVHIMEAYWNYSMLDQVMGRAIRYCSHKALPAKDRTVLVIIYAAIAGDVSKEPAPQESIDLYMLSVADRKRSEIAPYMEAIEDVAVDRLVHYG